ncbi:MAG: hypothetical protein DRP08_05945 [Candidatus Aenigmatarchaeota archaeon]|nr:MAG: hypothetical protein DRP08_05945 [Candidatus Aenigmarchaeota archaeon]
MLMVNNSIRQVQNLAQLSLLEATASIRNKVFGTTGILGCKPINVTIEVTNRCSLRCQMCGIWKAVSQDEVGIEEWIRIIDVLKKWLGTFKLTITGGEPFIKPGIWQLLRHCISINLPVVVITNGYSLSTRHLHQLSTLHLTQLVISLDSLIAETHDRLRGVQGAFKKTWETLSFLIEHSRPFLLSTNTTITENNILELGAIATRLEEMDVDRIFFQPIQGGFAVRGNTGWPYNSTLWPSSPQRVERGINSLMDAMSRGVSVAHSADEIMHFRDYLIQGPRWHRPWGCPAGHTAFYCNAFGQIRLCAPCTRNIGSAREHHPAKIWNSKEAKNERARIAACQEACLLNCYRQYTMKEKLQYARQWIKIIKNT